MCTRFVQLKITALVMGLSLNLITGCAGISQFGGRDARDAPWDPPQGRSLFEQLPAEENAAERICCGRNVFECKPHQSPRC